MIDDKQFSEILKQRLPEAPRTQWFTRKVLNRLPVASSSPLERVAYALGIVAAVAFVVWSLLTDRATPGVTVKMLSGIAAATGILVSIACSVLRAKSVATPGD